MYQSEWASWVEQEAAKSISTDEVKWVKTICLVRYAAGNERCADAVGSDIALDFGYLLLHLPDYSQEEIIRMFPKSHPYMLALHCIRDLTHEKVAKFFRSSLILELDERLRLLERATDCFSKFDSDFSLAVLEEIEVEALNKLRDRLMKRLKIGREGWLEEGEQKKCEEIALRMLEDGMDIKSICRITKLSRSKVSKLERESGKETCEAREGGTTSRIQTPFLLGLNLRLEYIDALLETRPPLACLEVIAENFFTPGVHHQKLEKLRGDYELTLHCLGMNIGGVDPIDTDYLKKIVELRKKFAPRHTSDHFSIERHVGVCFHDLLPFPFNAESLRNVQARVAYVQDFLQESLVLENLSYYVEFNSSDMTEVEFINAVMQNTGARLLLDLNNLWVNEQNLGHCTQDFLAALNWPQVAQVHLAGAETHDRLYIDTHGADVSRQVLQLLHSCKAKLAPATLLIYERDNNLPPWQTLISDIARLQREINA